MKSKKNKWDPNDPKNHQVRGFGPGASLSSSKMPMESMSMSVLSEDSPLEAPVGGHSRDAKLMSPDTREMVLHSRQTEIEAFANDRGINPTIVAGICEAAMRMGKVPDLRQYGVTGDEAKAIKQFVAGEILNIAIEDAPPPGDKTVAETTAAGGMGATMRLGTGFLARPAMIDSGQIDKMISEREKTAPTLQLGTGVSDSPAMTMADIVRLGQEDAARLINAAEAGVRPTTEGQVPAAPTTTEVAPAGAGKPATEAETVPKPKGDKIGRALKGLGGKVRSPAEAAPGQWDNASHGTAPPENMDITVKETTGPKIGASVLRESIVSASVLRDPNSVITEEAAAEPETPEGMSLDEAKKWIAKAIKHPGALHKKLGVPEGEKIPAGKIAAAASKGGAIGKEARLAQTLKKLGKHK